MELPLRRALARCALAAAALGVAGCDAGGGRVAPAASAPSVVLVSVDTLRADRVGAYGAHAAGTATLDAIAAGGVRFEKAIAAAPITLPSHATLFTGLYPPRHGVRHNGMFRLAPERVTLAERFHDAGFATGAVVGAVVLASRYGLDQGFDHYDDAQGEGRASATGYPERRAEEVTDAALRWLAGVDRPFFLFVHYYDPHAEYQPPAPFAERFAGRPYEGEVAYVDAQVGRLLEGLRASGRLERTIVAVTSDHGEGLGEHGERTHSYTLYDATLAVPLLVQGPGVPRGRVVPGVVSLASLAPTLLALAGLPPLADADGRDLAPLFAEGRADETAYAESLATQLDHGWAPLHALRTSLHHYVRAPRPELYDVVADPRERTNLLERGPRPEAKVAEDAVAGLLARALPLRSAPVDERTLGELRALGYALPDAPVADSGLDPKDGLRLVEAYVSARGAFFAGRLDEAERGARELLAASPASGQTVMLLAGVEHARGQLREAIALAERAASLVPASALYRLQVADWRAEAGDAAGALAGYEAALAIDPALAEAHAGAMWRAKLTGDLRDAEAAAARALELAPRDAALQLRVADVYDRLGAPEPALAAYEAALRLDPAAQPAHMGAAIQLARLGRDAEVDARVAAAGAYGTDPNYGNRLAIAFAARGESARAEATFRAVLAASPEHPNARRNLAKLLRQLGREGDARALEAAAPAPGPARTTGG
ncbi:MAG TPA: sulfatase-like hydrolase/transferase [Myxococcota bacterium]|nr:sulfatase-like hydrolase/transferase [Myxococcota bacterium]